MEEHGVQGTLALVADLSRADPYEHLLPADQPVGPMEGPADIDAVVWDIPHTIADLAYSTHSYFRYYGKFPPVIPKRLLRDYPVAANQYVLDPFAGCGTTLVEARLAGVNSIGIDINPLGALAGRVKTWRYDPAALARAWDDLSTNAKRAIRASKPPTFVQVPPDRQLEKWFAPVTAVHLAALKGSLLSLPRSETREFFLLAFLAIIRRVSRAYDGEVRPHINPAKRQRDVFQAFAKKVVEMIDRARGFWAAASPDSYAQSICGDARDMRALLSGRDHACALVVTHPPYLNCFDYFPVYSLELMWARGFDELPNGSSTQALRHREIRAWPATNSRLVADYFAGLTEVFRSTLEILVPGGHLCVVVGDCTVKGQLVPVHLHLLRNLATLGFQPVKIVYRTTHYGIGKYAYSSRAGYHGPAAAKRDAILILKKPP